MKKHAHSGSAEVNLGFQIAPMIDVVFVILLYFMVMVGAVQKENAHNTRLPSYGVSVETPDEIAIRIEDDGQVYLNDDPLDSVQEGALPELTDNLKQLKSSSEASRSEVLVTVYASNTARYQRMIDVLDSLGQARIESVAFQAGSEE